MSSAETKSENSAVRRDEYRYAGDGPSDSHEYLAPRLSKILARVSERNGAIFEIGAGNGSIANMLTKLGYQITAVEPSSQGRAIAHRNYPDLKIYDGSGYDDLAALYGIFPVVLSLEVIEHLYAPRDFVRNCWDLLAPGGYLVLSTPFHGYWKNLALALSGKLDKHFGALWDHGHIKFWSVSTLTILLEEAGFTEIEFHCVGRIPPLAKSMFAIARKPQ